MIAARRAVGRMIDTLLDQDRFSVVVFDTSNEFLPTANGLLASGTNRERWSESGLQRRGDHRIVPER